MNRSTTTIKSVYKNKNKSISVIICSAGGGHRIKSNEPRSLIRINGDTLINHQTKAIKNSIEDCEIIGVFGIHIEKILKKINPHVRITENQIHESTNTSESMRIGLNNSVNDNVLFIHGDIYFEPSLFKNANFNKSFLIIDGNNNIEDKEVGVTVNKNSVSILSYGLKKKWCQICYLTGKELRILKNIFSKFKESDKKMLSFELLNKVIENGGTFQYYENSESKIVEIDCIKDINNENFNL